MGDLLLLARSVQVSEHKSSMKETWFHEA